jgi:hypothetical protein
MKKNHAVLSVEVIEPDLIEAAVSRGLNSYCRIELMMTKGRPFDLYAYTVKMQKFTSRLEDIIKKVSVKPDSIKFVFSSDDVEVSLMKGDYRVSAIIDAENLNCVHCIIQKGESIGGKYFEGEDNTPVIEWLNTALSIGE